MQSFDQSSDQSEIYVKFTLKLHSPKEKPFV